MRGQIVGIVSLSFCVLLEEEKNQDVESSNVGELFLKWRGGKLSKSGSRHKM